MTFKKLLRLVGITIVSTLALNCILRGLGVDFGNWPYIILGAVIGIFTPIDED